MFKLKNDKATKEIYDPDKEEMMTGEIYKKDKRIKNANNRTKNRVGLKYISCIDFKGMTENEIVEQLSESWHPKNGYEFKVKKTYVKRKSIISGQTFYERYDTPYYCSPSSESYWSM